MKVKAIVNIDDLQDKVFRPVGSIFEVSEERAEYLLKNKAIEIIKDDKSKKKKSSKK